MTCAIVSRNPSGLVKHLFNESVFIDEAMAAEFRSSLAASVGEAPYGSRVKAPKFDNLISNVTRVPAVNHFAENTVAIALGTLHFAGLEAARRPWRLIDSMLSARVAAPDFTDGELQQLETEIESEINPLQIQYVMGDRSHKVKMQLLEKFEHYREVLDQIIAKLRRDLYGEKR